SGTRSRICQRNGDERIRNGELQILMVKASILWLHKWLAIISGVVVFILGLTGCMYTFHDDLKLICYPEKYFIPSAGTNKTLPLSKLTEMATHSLTEGEKITRV